MNRPPVADRPNHNAATPANQSAEDVNPLAPDDGGWHCSHLYYSFDRVALNAMASVQREAVARALTETLDPAAAHAPTRLQTQIVSGHKADFGVVMLNADPLVIDAIHQRLMASAAGAVLRPGYSFVSVTEISEYVPSVEGYGKRLVSEGDEQGSPAYNAKLKAYSDRLEGMNRQRLTPELPPYPAVCFYPMNKKRKVGENWFTLSKEERSRMMGEHARSGMAYAGKVSQLITVGLGMDDWEWGVTLWGANPKYLKDIVYEMRFDEASARYAEFGPFLVGYVADTAQLIDHCRVRR
ncbi:hydrogen peroxide-dependent heme synthase [Botrimarina hoheduenensis]|uniref:Putative heme peroxidase n=1 Tax=Botrimarina hoheduenensis TaxID=2528000 RepID=A0A5C5VWR0_9BACT|nr:hydrogen peroxide-dependent heme synthase [Botrimarina hoheduenensis]TWT42547.1 putative heme peroxidase [Botrimarina hoheduenensis]